LRTGLPLQYSPQEQHHMHGGELAPGEDGTAIEIIDALALVTAPDGQATATVDTKEASIRARCMAMRTPLPGRMEVLLQPGDALVIIQKVYNWKVHVVDLTSCALLVLLSQTVSVSRISRASLFSNREPPAILPHDTAFPCSEYYDGAVALSLAAGRQSHIPSARYVSSVP
jgi:hypothetical protein